MPFILDILPCNASTDSPKMLQLTLKKPAHSHWQANAKHLRSPQKNYLVKKFLWKTLDNSFQTTSSNQYKRFGVYLDLLEGNLRSEVLYLVQT